MTTDNLPAQVEPKEWSEYFYQRQQIKDLTDAIQFDRMPPAFFISGPSGTGKTTAIKLLIKSTHCQNRQRGEFQPCNNCATCRLDPRTAGPTSNVLWIQSGKDDSLTTQFNKALEEAYLPPYGYDEPHRFYKFIVFEELQSIPLDKLQSLLFYPELNQLIAQNRVVFIFNTMNESRIEDNALQALQDRGTYLRFKPLSEQQVWEYLIAKFPELPLEGAKLISMTSKGSFRRAIQAYKRCVSADNTLTTASIAERLNFAIPQVRHAFYNLLKACTPSNRSKFFELDKFWKQLEQMVEVDEFIEQMDRDLDLSIIAASTTTDALAQFQAREILYSYRISKAKVRAFDAVKLLAGKSIFDPAIFQDQEEQPTGFSSYFGIQVEG